MQIHDAREAVLQRVVIHSIMILVVCVKEKDILIMLGPKHHEADIHARVELFIINVPHVLQQKQVLMLLQLHTIKMHDVLLNMQQHLLRDAVLEEGINGTDIIIFCARFAEGLVIQILNGVQFMLVLQRLKNRVLLKGEYL